MCKTLCVESMLMLKSSVCMLAIMKYANPVGLMLSN